MEDNNDPIKDYNPAMLKLSRLKEKLEMYADKEDSVNDLHDCSNDLSDKGSRREEYEHAKFAESKRQNFKKDYSIYIKNTSEKTPKKLNLGWIIKIFIFSIIFFQFFISLVIGILTVLYGSLFGNF